MRIKLRHWLQHDEPKLNQRLRLHKARHYDFEVLIVGFGIVVLHHEFLIAIVERKPNDQKG